MLSRRPVGIISQLTNKKIVSGELVYPDRMMFVLGPPYNFKNFVSLGDDFFVKFDLNQ
jgi:hypothetical protein